MRKLFLRSFAAIALLSLSGCSWLLQQPGSAPKAEESPKLEKGKLGTITGKVVMSEGAYRFSPLDDPETLLRLTRARRKSEFEKEQINLRKYYEKTISVNGGREDDWIWGADIVGQWVPPGGDTGPNMQAPKPTKP